VFHLIIIIILFIYVGGRALRYQKGNQKSYIKDGQIVQWAKEKGQTMIYKTTQKTKDLATPTPLKTGGELRCSGRKAVPGPLVAPFVILFWRTGWVESLPITYLKFLSLTPECGEVCSILCQLLAEFLCFSSNMSFSCIKRTDHHHDILLKVALNDFSKTLFTLDSDKEHVQQK